jgi:hypothetical protein
VSLPPCAGLWKLFDSTDPVDHIEARALCMGCPMLLECHDRRMAAHRNQYSTYGPTGTWAGQLVGPRIAKCGTDSGYFHHRRALKEEACDRCKAAHSQAERQRTSEGRAA